MGSDRDSPGQPSRVELAPLRPAVVRSYLMMSACLGLVALVVVVAAGGRPHVLVPVVTGGVLGGLVGLLTWVARRNRADGAAPVVLEGQSLSVFERGRRRTFAAREIRRPTVKRGQVVLTCLNGEFGARLPIPRSRVMPFTAGEKRQAEAVTNWWIQGRHGAVAPAGGSAAGPGGAVTAVTRPRRYHNPDPHTHE